jgi:hypothetical protein
MTKQTLGLVAQMLSTIPESGTLDSRRERRGGIAALVGGRYSQRQDSIMFGIGRKDEFGNAFMEILNPALTST